MTCCESNNFVKEPIVRQWKWRDLMNCKGDHGFEHSEFEINGEGRESSYFRVLCTFGHKAPQKLPEMEMLFVPWQLSKQ